MGTLRVWSVVPLVACVCSGVFLVRVLAGQEAAKPPPKADAEKPAVGVIPADTDRELTPSALSDEPTLCGSVTDAENHPVKGADVLLSCGVMPDGSVPVTARTTSDSEGRFRLKWPGRDATRSADGHRFVLWAYRAGSGLGMRGLAGWAQPGGPDVEIRFQPSKTLQFKVVGAHGQAKKGIRVAPSYVYDRSAVYPSAYPSAAVADELMERLAVESNDDGLVEFKGLPPQLEVWLLRVTTPSGCSQGLSPDLDKSPPHPIVLAEATGRIVGRVVNLSGEPVSDATVDVWSPANHPLTLLPVTIGGQRSFRTAADGRFSLPPQLFAGQAYRLAVRMDGMEPCYSPAFQPRVNEEYHVPDLVLRPLRAIEGRVLDRAGHPVAGARVMQSGDGPSQTQTRTDEQGRFRLAGFRQGNVLLFVEQPGFRFYGQIVDAKSTRVDVVLARTTEPPTRSLRALPSVLPADEERKLAVELLMPLAREAMEKPQGSFAASLADAMAEFDPASLLQWLGKDPNIDAQTQSFVTYQLARNLAKKDLDEATALATSIRDATMRVRALLDISAKLSKSDRDKSIEVLGQAQVQAHAANSPVDRIRFLSLIAGRWQDLGHPDRAHPLLRTAKELAEKTSKDPSVETARWQLAESLATLDLAAALELLKNIKQNNVRDRPYLLIAIRLAGTNSEEAERMFVKAGVSLTPESGSLKARLCQRMAKADLPRARRIAASIDEPIWRARALFQIADAIAVSNPAAARESIGEGFSVLTQFSEADQVAARYAAGALPLIERIDAGLVEEYLERAIAMRSPVPDVRGAYYRSWNDADLARGVAIYDRHLASLLLGAFEDCLRSKDTRARIDAELEALVLVDPRRAIELAQGLPDTSEDPSFPVKTFTILRVARMLGRHDEARLRAIMRLAGLEVENGEEF